MKKKLQNPTDLSKRNSRMKRRRLIESDSKSRENKRKPLRKQGFINSRRSMMKSSVKIFKKKKGWQGTDRLRLRGKDKRGIKN